MLGKKRILIIDDSQSILLVVKSMLENLGFLNVSVSSCPRESLEAIERDRDMYDLIFTDLNMPDMDGMEVIRRLGAIGFRGGVVIISSMESRIIALASEIARLHRICLMGTIAKPIDVDSIKRILYKLGQIDERKFVHYDKLSLLELDTFISNKRVGPYYQPKLNIKTNTVNNVEVLARIFQPGCTDAILPGRFIPTALQHDRIDVLTIQLVEQTVKELPELMGIFGEDVKVSINLSPSQLVDLEFPKRLEALFELHKVAKEQIVLEITEEFELKSAEQLESLNRLRMRGYGIALDDFGTGFTNLQQLRSLPFSEVKIDRSLVDHIHNDLFNQVIVSSLVDISSSMDVELVAEGVEDIRDYTYLESHYSNLLVQGFLVCKPKPIDSLRRWYHSWISNAGEP